MNFSFQRNPAPLISYYGIPPIRTSKQEKHFLSLLGETPTRRLHPLLLVVGGFLDQMLGNSYAVSAHLAKKLEYDVFFREHYEAKSMCSLVRLYASHGFPITLVGHSWGGDAAVNAVARQVDSTIALLITLDPVSRKGPPRRKLINVGQWINIYVDYSITPWWDIPNLVARIGGPWEAVDVADSNIVCPLDLMHAHAWGMFSRFGEPFLRNQKTASLAEVESLR